MSNYELLTILHTSGKDYVWVDLKKVFSIYVHVISNDEIVTVTYTDGTTKKYDPGKKNRDFDKLEGKYCIYLPSKKINLIDVFNVEQSPCDILNMKYEDLIFRYPNVV